MGKLGIFDISFSNMSGVFYAGTNLQGQVTVELHEPMKMRGVAMVCFLVPFICIISSILFFFSKNAC